MPGLDTKIHIDMLSDFKRRNFLPLRVLRALKRSILDPQIYGLEWGDPEVVAPLGFVRDRYLLPYVKPDHVALEIGPGGGRWTRYMLDFSKVYIIDFHQELLDQLKKSYRNDNLVFIKNSGSDFPGVPDNSVDFVFSFGVFVHLDEELIRAYLAEMRRVLKPGGNGLLQFADKTKIMAKDNPGFSDNNPEKMRGMLHDAGFVVVEEDNDTMWHSGIVRFQPAP